MAETTITEDMCIGTVIERFPATEPVFKKFFGDGCFTCPGAKNEDLLFLIRRRGSTIYVVVKLD